MAHYLFNGSVEGWSGDGFAHSAADGSPTLGCLAKTGSFGTATVSRTGLSIPVSSGDNLSFHCKFSGALSSVGGGVITLIAKDNLGTVLGSVAGATAGIDGEDAWKAVSTTLALGGMLASLEIAVTGSGNVLDGVFYDTVYVGGAPPADIATSPLRILGLVADNENLYAVGIHGGTINLLTYALTTLEPEITGSFGSASYTDPDTFVKGLYPVLKPHSDKVLYLRGRDGNSKQLWYRDFNGTLGWVDVGPGTATWGTAKFAVALMPWPAGPNDVIVAFSDDDIYQTNYGTATWVKQGDATTGLRCAARSDFEATKLLMGGTAAGTVLFTQNKGVSSTAGGTAAGTINAVEWSYPNA